MISSFKKLLDQRRKEYKAWNSVRCRTLNQDIHFTMAGFNHLRFNIDNTPRKPAAAMYKMGLLPLVRPVIHNATDATYERRTSPVGGSRKRVYKDIEYWSLTAIVGSSDVKVRVVLRRIVGGEKIHFWSVMKLGEHQKIPE